MSVGLLLITHGDIGTVMLESANQVLGGLPIRTEVLQVAHDADLDGLRRAARAAVRRLQHGDGVLVLTDIYGGTPSNIGRSVADCRQVLLLAGLNLPMLIRVMNYPDLDLASLADKAVSGGRDGIYLCQADDQD